MSEWDEDSNPWVVKGVSRAFENNWFHIEAHDVIRPDGADGSYGVIRIRRLAVGVLPIEADGSVHLVGQWRFPLGRYSWEMPEGGAEPGEAAIETARRELEEEAGLLAGRLEPILEMDISNSLTDERAIAFLATELRPGRAAPEPTEVFKYKRVPFVAALQRALDGRIRDSLTVAALLRAHHMAVTGALPESLARAMLAEGET